MTAKPLHPDQALALVLAEVEPLASERVPLEAALGRVSAAPVLSRQAVPGFDNSAMDGFAVRSADAERGVGEPLRIVAESSAGHPAAVGPQAGEAVRISTGAMVPAGADAVVPVEQTEEDERGVRLRAAPAAGANVRRAGEDVEPGDRVLDGGTWLGAAELGVLASVGVAELECARRPTVAVLTGGDELVVPGPPLAPGQIYDTSRFSVPALAAQAGAEVVRVDTVGDDPAASRAAIERALACDVAVICGGVSVGPHDHVRPALAALGVEERFWRVALRPGKPTWFGVAPAATERARALVFGLPGNPVSALVTFHVFVRPALRAMQGLDPTAPAASATLDEPYVSSAGRVEYLRCRAELADDGLHVRPSRASQGSHILTSMAGADALAVIPAELTALEPGQRLPVELLEGRDLDWLRP
jgi:molybdopterin molybdotransferase